MGKNPVKTLLAAVMGLMIASMYVSNVVLLIVVPVLILALPPIYSKIAKTMTLKKAVIAAE